MEMNTLLPVPVLANDVNAVRTGAQTTPKGMALPATATRSVEARESTKRGPDEPRLKPCATGNLSAGNSNFG